MATKPATTVTLKHLAASLAEDNELSKKQAEAILGGLVGQIVKHLKKGERIRIGGLGILQVRKRAARMGRNPALAKPSKSRRARRSPSAPPRSLRKRSEIPRLREPTPDDWKGGPSVVRPRLPAMSGMDPARPRPTAPAGFHFFLMQTPARQDLRRSRPARIWLILSHRLE